MNLTFKSDLYKVKVNRQAKYLPQRSFNSVIIVRTVHTDIHTPARLLNLDY